MIYALFGLFFVITCLLAFFSVKTWNWLHITALVLNGLLAMFALVLVANYMDWQRKWRVAYDRNLADLQEARAVGRSLKYGDPMKDVQEEPTFVELAGRFNRLVYQRGRVWRRCSRRNVQNNQYQLQVLPDNAPANMAHGIAREVTLYAFLEQIPFAPGGADQAAAMRGQGDAPPFLLPGAYLGEFTVVATDAKTVTLRPAVPLDPYQQQHVRAGATWVLYEVMPVDGHYVFATDESGGIVEYVEPNDDPKQQVFGVMDSQMLTRLFDTAVSVNFPRAAGPWRKSIVERLVNLYRNDGRSLEQDEADRTDPEELWYKVEFLQTYDKYQVGANPEDISLSDTRSWFERGIAVDPRLVRNNSGTVTLKKGQYGIFKRWLEDEGDEGERKVRDDLDDLIDKGVCKIVATIFVRRLNDYRDGFQLISSESQRVREAIRLVTANTAQWQQATRDCQSQITYRSNEKMKLDGDGLPEGQIGELAGFRRDVEAAGKLLEELTKQKAGLLEELSRLYRANAALREQLAAVQRYLKEQIDQRTEAAVTLR